MRPWMLLWVLLPLSARASDGLDAAWAERGTVAGVQRLEELLEERVQQEGAPSEVWERLAHAYLFHADWLEPDAERAQALRRKGLRAALEGLQRVPQLAQVKVASAEDLEAAGALVPKGAAGLHHLAAQASCQLVPTESAFRQLAAAKRCKRLLERTVSIDGAWFHGEPLRALAGFLLRAPEMAGGDERVAQRVLQKALAVEGRYGPTLLVEILVLERTGAGAELVGRKWQALAQLAADALPDAQPEQEQAIARARKLLEAAR